MKILRVGVIGSGFGSQVLVPALRQLEDCEVNAIVTSHAEKARALAKTLGIPRSYGSWAQLLDQEPLDALAIAVPARAQQEILAAALKKEIPVFCEKPVAICDTESRKLLSQWRKHRVPLVVDFEFTQNEAFQLAKPLVTKFEKGLSRVELNWRVMTFANKHRLENWKGKPEAGGGVLNLFGSHAFYNLEWFLGPLTVQSACLGKPQGDKRGTETFCEVQLQTAHGVPVTVSLDCSFDGPTEHTYRWHSSQGVLELTNRTKDYLAGFELFRDGNRVSPALKSRARDGRIDEVGRLLEAFAKWIRGGPPVRPNLEDGHRVQVVMNSVREKAKKEKNEAA